MSAPSPTMRVAAMRLSTPQAPPSRPTPSRTMAIRATLLGGIVLAAMLVMAAMTPPRSDRRIERLVTATREHGAPRIFYPATRAPQMALPGGRSLTVHSVLNVDHVLSYGDYVWNDDGVGPGPISIRVDLGRQLLSVFRGGDEIGTALVLFGTDSKPTPHGLLTIKSKDENHYSRSYDVAMPYTLMLTSDGIAIHAADVRVAEATHGCIGIPVGIARRLFAVAHVGDAVAIVAPGAVS